MKNGLILIACLILTSCATVDSGHKGVRVSFGGKTDMTQVYSEGFHAGIMYLIDNMIEYDVREKTTVQRFEFNDKPCMHRRALYISDNARISTC